MKSVNVLLYDIHKSEIDIFEGWIGGGGVGVKYIMPTCDEAVLYFKSRPHYLTDFSEEYLGDYL